VRANENDSLLTVLKTMSITRISMIPIERHIDEYFLQGMDPV
jgi:hypothetical protein